MGSLSKNKFKKVYFRTQESLFVYFKIAQVTRTVGTNFFGSQLYLPLFPICVTRGCDLINADSAFKMIEAIW
jgi:hypothetical protein